MQQNVLIHRKYILKYLGVKRHDISHLLSNVSVKIIHIYMCVYVYTYTTYIYTYIRIYYTYIYI